MKRIAWVVVTASLAFSTQAFADPTKRECIDANADAQVKQKEGQLHAAQGALKVCIHAACPAAVRDDCTQRLAALTPLIPAVVFEAKDAKGNDLSAVKVTMDGQPLAEKLDGNPIEVDPGEHTFTFETAGAPVVTKKLVLRQGESARREQVVLGDETPAPAPVEPKPAAPPASPPAEVSGLKTVGVIVAGVGLLGVGAGAVLGAMAGGKWSDAKDACSTTRCPDRSAAEDTRRSALSLATGSTIAFIAGGVLIAGGVVLWIASPSSSSRVGVAPTPNGALLTGSF